MGLDWLSAQQVLHLNKSLIKSMWHAIVGTHDGAEDAVMAVWHAMLLWHQLAMISGCVRSHPHLQVS